MRYSTFYHTLHTIVDNDRDTVKRTFQRDIPVVKRFLWKSRKLPIVMHGFIIISQKKTPPWKRVTTTGVELPAETTVWSSYFEKWKNE